MGTNLKQHEKDKEMLKEETGTNISVIKVTGYSKCGLCMKMPEDARVLSCFHSFCLQCLKEYMHTRLGKNYLPCPLCGRDTSVKDGDIESIQRNPYLTSDNCSRANLLCDLCEDEREAEATCLDCGEKMCTFCHQSHKNSKASKHHRIKLFGAKFEVHVNGHFVKSVVNKDICSDHETEERDYYCRKCRMQICKMCRDKNHQGHRTRPLSAFINTKRKEISEVVETIQNGYVERLKRRICDVSTQMKQLSENVESVLLELSERGESLKRDIDMVKTRVSEDVKEKEKVAMDDLDKLKMDLTMELLASGGCIQYIQNVLKLGTDHEVLSVCSSMGEHLLEMRNGKSVPKVEKVTIGFEAGEITNEILQNGFGNCTTRNAGVTRSRSVSFAGRDAKDICVKLVSTFEYPSENTDDYFGDESIRALATTSNGEAWACRGWEAEQVTLISSSGDIVKQLDIKAKIDDIARTQDNGLLLSCLRDTSVKKLNQDLEVTKLFKMPFFPRGLATAADGGLLVCMTDEYSTSVLRDSRRLVAKYSESGELIRSFENDGNRRLFTRPYRVTENINGDICVTDKTSMGAGRVVVLDSDGKLKYIYEGSYKTHTGRGFSPAGLCCDKFGRILVADCNNHNIHILDKSGQFLGYLLTKEDGICSPHSLSLDPNGYLWLGDENGVIKVYLYI